MTPEELVRAWRYYVAHFQHHRDNCTDTPHGRKLRAIYHAAFVAAAAELEDAVHEARAALAEGGDE